MTGASVFSAGRLHQIGIGVSDLERSIEFYRDRLGAQLVARFDPAGLAFFQLGEVRLLLEQGEAPTPGSGALYFHTSDIQRAFETLKARGVRFDSEPHLIHRDTTGSFGPKGAEEWMAFFRDPDGHVLALAARISAA